MAYNGTFAKCHAVCISNGDGTKNLLVHCKTYHMKADLKQNIDVEVLPQAGFHMVRHIVVVVMYALSVTSTAMAVLGFNRART